MGLSPVEKLTALVVCLLLVGCRTARRDSVGSFAEVETTATRIEYPDVQRALDATIEAHTLPPRTLETEPPREFWDLSYEGALRIALANGKIIRDLGARVLRAPQGATSVFDPAISESDPLFGTEAALSEFDAGLSTSIFWERNDRGVNNEVLGGGAFEILQDIGAFQGEFSKVAATGTRFSVSNLTRYDQSNQRGNFFPSAWDTQFNMEVRHPLLQGGGITFNRIAGPDADPGFNFSTGVIIARIRTDISLADFERGVRDFVSQLEDAYWDLYFAYRDLDAKMLARDGALDTWQSVQAKLRRRLRGGEADKEAQAREQFFLFQDLVQNALAGSPDTGQFVGVYHGERRLRRMMGLPSNDGRMIRPADEPITARLAFDWERALQEALVRRVELRQQMWQIERRELELIAARNFTLPRLDAVGRYRWRGLGDDLTGGAGGRFASAFKDLGSGDHQEWRLGLELTMPLGFRQAWAGVRNAELQVARERAILQNQELTVAHALSDAMAEVVRAHAAVRVNFNRLDAARQRRDATEAAFRGDQAPLNLLLDAQQRLSNAQSRYFQSLTQYAKAVKNVHLEKGTLLEANGVLLSEGRWPGPASRDAAQLRHRRRRALIDYRIVCPPVVSQGEVPQHPDFGSPTEVQSPTPEVLPPPPS